MAAITVIASITLAVQPLAAHADADPSTEASRTVTPGPVQGDSPAEAAASAEAVQSGRDVVVDGTTTPTSQVVADPDGSMRLTQTTEPTRVLQDGDWVKVDTSLETRGAWLEPAAVVAPVQFSTGGSDLLARVQTPTGQWVAESLPASGSLPAPTVDGDSATYDDVLPGVDLTLTANATGMSEVFTVQDASAAANPDLRAMELAVRGGNVSENTTSATATAPDGSSVSSSKPTWWDASHDGDVAGPGGDAIPQPLPHSSDADSLTLDVGQAPTSNVQYPLYVDPDWSAGQQNFWFTDRAYPNQSYLNGSPAGYQSVGYAQQGGVTYLSRAFWEFGTSALAGKHIIAAQFGAVSTYSCSAVPVEAWRYGPANPGFTWNSDPGQWVDHLDTQNFASTGGCGISPTSVGWNVTRGVSDIAAASGSRIQIGLRSGNEGSISRKHFDNNARLTVTYNTKPRTPTALQMTSPERSCSTNASSPAYVNNRAQALTFQLNATDPDPQNVQSTFEIAAATNLGTSLRTFNTAASAQGTQSATLAKASYNSDTPTALAYRAITTDGTDYGSWSGWCYFTVKNKGPALPDVANTSSASSTIGKPVTVTVKYAAADAIRSIAYWWTPTAPTTPAPAPPATITPQSDGDCDFTSGPVTGICATGSTTTTLTVAPTDSTATLWVATYDKAGNVSLDTDGHAASIGLGFTNVADDPAIAIGPGHSWTADDSTAPTSTLTDRNTTAGTGTSAAAPITVGANTTTAPTTNAFRGPQGATALDFSSANPLISINRFSGNYHSAVINGSGPSGSHWESNLGDLLSPGQPSTPDLTKLYSCDIPSGNMTSSSASCEGSGVTGTALGYAWKTADAVPAPLQPVAVYRCTSGTDHFDSTSANCEGRTVESRLGYFAKQTVTKTTTPVVDTTKSFTAAAWIKPAEADAAHHAYTAMSQNGTSNYAFLIKVDGPRLQGCLHAQTTGSAACATATFTLADTDEQNWTYVALQWDAVNHQLRLFVNGELASDTTSTTVKAYTLPAADTAPTGPFMLGSAMVSGETGDLFAGQLVNPVVFQGIASSTQMNNLKGNGALDGGF